MQKVAILYDAGQAVLSTFDLDEVLQRILTIVRDYFHVPYIAVLLRDEDSDELYMRCQIGWDESFEKKRFSMDSGVTGAAAREKRPIYVADVNKDPRYVPAIKETRSELALPLMVRDTVVGVLDCQSDKSDHFDQETIDLLLLF